MGLAEALVTVLVLLIIIVIGSVIIRDFYSAVLPEQPLFMVLAVVGFIAIGSFLILSVVLRRR